MLEKSIVKIIPNMPNSYLANGIPKCELYIVVNDVEKYFKKSILLGAKEINLSKQKRLRQF